MKTISPTHLFTVHYNKHATINIFYSFNSPGSKSGRSILFLKLRSTIRLRIAAKSFPFAIGLIKQTWNKDDKYCYGTEKNSTGSQSNVQGWGPSPYLQQWVKFAMGWQNSGVIDLQSPLSRRWINDGDICKTEWSLQRPAGEISETNMPISVIWKTHGDDNIRKI